MGTGVNVQNKLIALHHLGIPWKPSCLTQRNGRILRQGNKNEEVSIFNYITENTFDAYLWQILEQKQRYIAQIMTGRSAIRSCEDIDETVLQYAEFKALAISDPKLKLKMEVDNELSRLTILKSAWQANLTKLQRQISKLYPNEIAKLTIDIAKLELDVKTVKKNKPLEFEMTIANPFHKGKKDFIAHTERTKAAEHFEEIISKMRGSDEVRLGFYAGFKLSLRTGGFLGVELCIKGEKEYIVDIRDSGLGAITRLENAVDKIETSLKYTKADLSNIEIQLEIAKEQIEKPFTDEERFVELQKQKIELDLSLEFKNDGSEDLIDEENDDEILPLDSPRTIEQRLYKKIYPFMENILSGEIQHIKYIAKNFDDFVIENIGDSEYSVAYYFEQNGNLMRSPEVTFKVDFDEKELHPLSYTMDSLGIYYETENVAESTVIDLKGFMEEWFDSVANTNYVVENNIDDETYEVYAGAR